MFCARCGQQIADASEICPLCGREATIKIPPPSPEAQAAVAPALAPAPAATPAYPPIRADLQGVGGWLLFFCVGLVLLGPMLTLTQVFNSPNADASVMGLELSRAAFGLVVGIVVWNVRPIAFTLLWIYFGIVAAFAVLGIIGSANTGQGLDRGLSLSIRSLFYVFVWFLYFRRSERVRATFGRNL